MRIAPGPRTSCKSAQYDPSLSIATCSLPERSGVPERSEEEEEEALLTVCSQVSRCPAQTLYWRRKEELEDAEAAILT